MTEFRGDATSSVSSPDILTWTNPNNFSQTLERILHTYASSVEGNGSSTSGGSPNNQSTADDPVLGPHYHSHIRIFIIVLMIAFSTAGNSVVCWKLLTRRRRRCSFKAQVLFLNLAIADLLVTLVTMTSQMVWEIMGRVWVAGDAFCRMFKVLQTFTLASSTYVIVSIALDRHFAIVSPLAKCPGPWKLATAAWVAALMPSLPNIYVFRLVEANSAGDTSNDSFRVTMMKTLRMTVLVFGAFIGTNIPYMVQEMVLAFSGSSVALSRNIVALFGVISASNSAINPYIYLLFQRRK
ncbi:hypothetical protein HPB47_019265 [Ixodes persulcatus]|uniref:Uncharacterized protein n=1 Tax=Ixodes persulcatus TaxID=34615 RepID=A0AC60QIM7_IXOPE|nr:hypothetical protein HPB47_019265 [Ixodes persulcatus]